MGKGTAFIAGAGVGAILALLLSPNSGPQNRQKIADAAGEIAGQAPQFVSNAGENIRSGFDKVAGRVQGFVGSAGENIRSGVQSVADQAAPVADDIRIKINEARDRIAEQVTNRRNGVKTVDADVSDVAAEAAEGGEQSKKDKE